MGGEGDPYTQKHLATAHRHEEAGHTALAIASVRRVLELHDQHLEALELWAKWSRQLDQLDEAAYAMHAWLRAVDSLDKPPVSRKEVQAMREALLEIDPQANALEKMRAKHLKALFNLAKEHFKKKRLHAALNVLDEVLRIEPNHSAARTLKKKIIQTGSDDVAIADAYAGADPLDGIDPEWLAKENPKHTEWSDAWEEKGENYSYKTNAGYLVLKTASIAMEQMNMAYRHFFHFKEDGKPTPRVTVHVFKDRDEYLKKGFGPPIEWSGGHFTGSHVETYVGGTSGKENILSMYSTLFHEAAHQFVGLTGKGGVPGWLNEAYASFFEGTTILSNGKVRWNEVASHRLFPLASRVEKGWMVDHKDGVRDAEGEWATPTRAPTLRILIENRYGWGPPWYAPTWGVVYFLYNYRDPETGRPVYREVLHDYYLSGAASRGVDQRVEHFENLVLKENPLSPVQDIDALNEIWGEWILQLRDIQLGMADATTSALAFGIKAFTREEYDLAMELFEEALLHAADDPNVLWATAECVHAMKNLDRAGALYRAFANELELRGEAENDERYESAIALVKKLDPAARKHARIREDSSKTGIALAKDYLARGLPLMALETTRQVSAGFASEEALALYTKITKDTGLSLAQWKVAFNEFDMTGWSTTNGYSAYGGKIKARIERDDIISKEAGAFLTRELTCETTIQADFSLETEMRFGEDANLMGLCFGYKDNNNTHAVMLLPKGFLQVVAKHGEQWDILQHRQVQFEKGWQKLRIDVVGTDLDVYLNGKYLMHLEMSTRDALRGGFGLITGTGNAAYRGIRLLARDPHDPAARMEREMAQQALSQDASLRAPGVFSGFTPPEPTVDTPFVQGETFRLKDKIGRPLVLMFWSLAQENIIPTAAYYSELAKRWGPQGFEFLALLDNTHDPMMVRQALNKTPMPGVSVAIDDLDLTTHYAYHVVGGDDGWNLPHILVLDVHGKVVWEGDPSLASGVGWVKGSQTPLDRPLEALSRKYHLDTLHELQGTLERVEAAQQAGDWKTALTLAAPLADLDADFDPAVIRVREIRNQILAEGENLPQDAQLAYERGWPLKSAAMLRHAVVEFPETSLSDLAEVRLRKLEKRALYRQAKKEWGQLMKITRAAGRGSKTATEIKSEFELLRTAKPCAEVESAIQALEEALKESGPEQLPEAWNVLQPTPQALESNR